MFVQVIRGKVSDPDSVRAALQTWVDELAPGATGWLGSTTGVTDDGTLIAVARFDTPDNARRNNDRPEQGRWWADTEKLFDGQVSFDDSTEVDDYAPGDPDSAGFVQVIQGQVSDLERAAELRRGRPEDLRRLRPDILAVLGLAHAEGRWTTVAYFTSEAEARQGESQAPPPDFAAAMEELASLSVAPTTYYDLRQVWTQSPQPARRPSMAGGS